VKAQEISKKLVFNNTANDDCGILRESPIEQYACLPFFICVDIDMP
jgi:hypothetical protein